MASVPSEANNDAPDPQATKGRRRWKGVLLAALILASAPIWAPEALALAYGAFQEVAASYLLVFLDAESFRQWCGF